MFSGVHTMKILLGTAMLLASAAAAIAQQPQTPPPAIPMPQDTLQRISIYLQEGGSHNEGFALSGAIMDAIKLAAVTKDRDDLKAAAAAKPAPPAPETKP